MVADSAVGGDWPGWDEGWAVVVFPLGVPLPVASGLAVAGGGLAGRPGFAVVTAAVWAVGRASLRWPGSRSGKPPTLALVEGNAQISTDVLASYAADAAREVARRARARGPARGPRLDRRRAPGGRAPPRRSTGERRSRTWRSPCSTRVRDYLARMADIEAPTVNVVVDEVGEPEET